MLVTARYIGNLDANYELWAEGPVAFVVPSVPANASPRLKNALSRRRQATLTGGCACGAQTELTDVGLSISHEDDCDAHDDSIRALLEEEAAS